MPPLNPRELPEKQTETAENTPKHPGISLVRKDQGKSKHQGNEDQGTSYVVIKFLIQNLSRDSGTATQYRKWHSPAGENLRIFHSAPPQSGPVERATSNSDKTSIKKCRDNFRHTSTAGQATTKIVKTCFDSFRHFSRPQRAMRDILMSRGKN